MSVLMLLLQLLQIITSIIILSGKKSLWGMFKICKFPENRITDIENRLVVSQGEGVRGEGWNERLGLADVNFYISNG